MSKTINPAEALQKIQRYCAYQERCHQEVRSKLYSFGLRSVDVEEILTTVILEGYLNEERFSKSFAGGKFRIKKWGRLRIVNELEKKGITPTCIRSGLKEIDEEDYLKTLVQLLESKAETLEEPNLYVKRDKVAKYAIQKGYEPDLVWKKMRELFPD